jgi:hypothetical protein
MGGMHLNYMGDLGISSKVTQSTVPRNILIFSNKLSLYYVKGNIDPKQSLGPLSFGKPIFPMAPRLQKTLLDYLIIAISPALIIVLVQSLVFFLVTVIYQGKFEGLLHYIFGLFVIGAVLTARISIEDGYDRAVLFAIPLGLVTLLAINKYVRYEDATLASLSFFINTGMIALIWWSADRLTWDCTVIDESEEDSGEGLLETVGLDRPDRESLQKEIAPTVVEPEATTNREKLPVGFWERYVERRRRPHAPGVWIIYYSLAALPLFGVGQLFIPADKLESRQYAFNLLFVYTACGLGLLLSTSFLGLRRYLRQRKQEMPFLMVNLWLGTGATLIAGVMFVALLLPRPNPEYAISELPFKIGSPPDKELESSRFGRGREGVDEKKEWTRGEDRKEKTSDTAPGKSSEKKEEKESGGKSGQAEKKSVNGDKSEGKSNEQSKGDNKSDANRDAGGKESGEKSGKSEKRSAEGEKSDQDKKGSAEGEKSEGKSSDRSAGEKKSDAKQDSPSRTGKTPPEEEKKPEENVAPQRREAQQPTPDRDRSIEDLTIAYHPSLQYYNFILQILAMGMKWMIYWVLGMLVVYWLWTQRDNILNAINNMGQWLINFWRHLFGGSVQYEEGDDEQPAKKPPPRRFADFVDPFATGQTWRYPPEELVRYTFEALEAWAMDHGKPRLPEQTPHEFARALGEQVAELSDDAGRLAELYCQAAYAEGTLPPKSAARLERLWQTMRAIPVPPPVNTEAKE